MFGSPSENRAQIQRNQDLSVEGLGELDVNCSICLQPMEDRTVIPKCSHDFCFDCLITWTGTCRLQTDLGFSADLHNVKSAQSCRCPLCTQAIGNYVIHDIQTRFDYRKHYLTPLRSASSQPLLPPRTAAAIEARNAARRRRRQGEHERQRRQDLNEHDKLELSIAIRRWIYQHELYAKVCTSTTHCF